MGAGGIGYDVAEFLTPGPQEVPMASDCFRQA
jgi:hypothetical protein